jgi:UPF0755 protein
MSRHARRGTQGEQDRAPGTNPGDGVGRPAGQYPPAPAPGAHRRVAYEWAADPRDQAGYPEGRDPQSPAGSAGLAPAQFREDGNRTAQSWAAEPGDAVRWDAVRWDGQPWDGQPWDGQPWDGQPWDGQPWDGQPWGASAQPAQSWAAPGGHPGPPSSGLVPLPPSPSPGPGHPSGPLSPLPGSGHPSGPLSPLPEPGPGWRDPDPAAWAAAPARPASPPAPVQPGSVQPSPAQPGQIRPGAGLPGPVRPGQVRPETGQPGPIGPGQVRPAAGRSGHPAARPGEAGQLARPGGAGPALPAAYPGYEQYVTDPPDLDTNSRRERGQYAAARDWYGDVGQPAARTEEGGRGDLLPGLDQGSGSRQAGPPAAGASARKRRRRGRAAILASLLVFVILLAVGGAVGFHYYRAYFDPPDFSGPGTGLVTVQITHGETAETVGQRLASLGVVASGRAFFNAAKASPRGSSLEPGTYRVRKHMKAALALALLLKPTSRVQIEVTIPEGYRLSQIIARLGRETGNLKGYQQAIARPAALGLPAFAHGRPEGYLFPATYPIQPRTAPLTVLRNMVQQFNLQATALNLKAAAARGHQGEGEVITVASIIEAEGKRPQDYGRIAEVIYNRLNARPPVKLQLDTTVLYAMSLAHSHAQFSTKFPSPYNTYLHANLPPGPIDSPGKAAIQAALHPDHGNYLYFLTVNSATGKTLFFSTSRQFDAAVAKYGSTGSGNTGTGAGSR